VLVVDDSPAIRARLLGLMSEVAGLVLAQAAGADEAMVALQVHVTDVVVLDLHMPGRSGLDVLPDIKALRPAPIVVMLTADPTEHHRRLCLARGADFFFDKATDFALVLELLRPA
jgi:CheY-like chemotaxis protein